MRTLQANDLFWLAKVADIRPATVRQLDTYVDDRPEGACRGALLRLTEIGLLRRYKEPTLPKRTWRQRYGLEEARPRRIGKRPWIYDTTLDGVTYLEGARKCDEVLRNLELEVSGDRYARAGNG